ncbi:MAG: CBS domain-containing protein [Candidatus Brocadiales bacterium]|nr:CBS domain-containing protein [Candidatus Bathyanammoxibius sp.]
MENLKARDVMTRPVVSARENASVRDVAMQLLCGLYSGMPVTNNKGEVVGVVTELDLLKAVSEGKELVRITAGDIMTRDVITVEVETPLDKVTEILMDKNIIRVPVTQDGKLTGVVSRCDVLRSFMEPEFITHM